MAITEEKTLSDNIWESIPTPPMDSDTNENGGDVESGVDVQDMSFSQATNMWAELQARQTELARLLGENPDDTDLRDSLAQVTEQNDTIESFIKNGNTTANINPASLMAAMGDAGIISGHSANAANETKQDERKAAELKAIRYAAFAAAAAASSASSLPLIYEFTDRETAFDNAYSSMFEGPDSFENVGLQATEIIAERNPEILETLSDSDLELRRAPGPEFFQAEALAAFDASIAEATANGDTKLAEQLTEAKNTFKENSDIVLQEMNVEDPSTEAGQAAIDRTLSENPDLVAAAGGEEAARTFLIDVLNDGDDESLALNESEIASLTQELAENPSPERRNEIELTLAQNELMEAQIDTMIDVKVTQGTEYGADLEQQGVTPENIMGYPEPIKMTEMTANLNAESNQIEAEGLTLDEPEANRRQTNVIIPFEEAQAEVFQNNIGAISQFRAQNQPLFDQYRPKEGDTVISPEAQEFLKTYDQGLAELRTEGVSNLNKVRAEYGLPPIAEDTPPIAEINSRQLVEPELDERSRSFEVPLDKDGNPLLGPLLGAANPVEEEPWLGPLPAPEPAPKNIWEEGFNFADASAFNARMAYEEKAIEMETSLLDKLKSGEGNTEELMSSYQQDTANEKEALRSSIQELMAAKLRDTSQNEADITAAAGEITAMRESGEILNAQGVEYNPETAPITDSSIVTDGVQNVISPDVKAAANEATADMSTNIEELLTDRTDTVATTGQALETENTRQI